MIRAFTTIPRKIAGVVAALLLLAGTALSARAVYLHAKAALAARLIRGAWEETIRTGRHQPPWSWADTYPVARLRIPRIGYDEIVLDGATPRTLAFGPARMRNSVPPGEPGNVVLAGHRTSWFEPLEKVAVGDVIELEWADTKRPVLHHQRYNVQALRVVAPSDSRWLAPTAGDALTLWTCYPFGRGPTSPQRYVIRAVR